MIQTENFEQFEIENIESLHQWLLTNHQQKDCIWLVTFKKSAGSKYGDRWSVLDELICFGWIDGIRRKLDQDRTMQLISPRRVEHWTKTYKDRAQALIEAGRMQEAGLQSIKTSKENGLWHFMDDVDQLIIPDDLDQALRAQPEAKLFFDEINPSSKRFVLRWLKLTKTEATRVKRIKELVSLSQKGEKLKGS